MKTKFQWAIGFLMAIASITQGCTCDDDDMQKAGVGYRAGLVTDGAAPVGLSAADQMSDQIIGALCTAAERCDRTISYQACVHFLEEEEPLSAVSEAEMDEGSLEACLDEIDEICDQEGESFIVGSYDNIKNLIPQEGACPGVLKGDVP